MAVNLKISPSVYCRIKNHHYGVCGSCCHFCQKTMADSECLLCLDCERDLPLNLGACPACAMPAENGLLCANCLLSRKQFINRMLCVYRYVYPVSLLIQDMKFRSRLDIVNYMGKRLADYVAGQEDELPQCLIPVPLHRSRLINRGFNQSRELARVISDELGTPVDYLSVKRTRNTKAQTDLGAQQRRSNMKGAFEINPAALSRYQHVAIIDDVITTGSTVQELARVIARAGITKIDVWACARATII